VHRGRQRLKPCSFRVARGLVCGSAVRGQDAALHELKIGRVDGCAIAGRNDVLHRSVERVDAPLVGGYLRERTDAVADKLEMIARARAIAGEIYDCI
jgi:hypothetical protein